MGPVAPTHRYYGRQRDWCAEKAASVAEIGPNTSRSIGMYRSRIGGWATDVPITALVRVV